MYLHVLALIAVAKRGIKRRLGQTKNGAKKDFSLAPWLLFGQNKVPSFISFSSFPFSCAFLNHAPYYENAKSEMLSVSMFCALFVDETMLMSKCVCKYSSRDIPKSRAYNNNECTCIIS